MLPLMFHIRFAMFHDAPQLWFGAILIAHAAPGLSSQEITAIEEHLRQSRAESTKGASVTSVIGYLNIQHATYSSNLLVPQAED